MADYFIFTKICVCKKVLKNYKFFLAYYDDSGITILHLQVHFVIRLIKLILIQFATNIQQGC